MKLEEIKDTVKKGRRVFWKNQYYEVVKDKYDQWFVHCLINNNYSGLFLKSDGILVENENDFFLEEDATTYFATKMSQEEFEESHKGKKTMLPEFNKIKKGETK